LTTKPRKRLFFYDTEFVEGVLPDGTGFIDLISIAFVPLDDGPTLYLVSKDFNAVRASDWVQENVFPHLLPYSERMSREEMKQAVLDYLKPSREDPVQLWAWYADYDHVALAQLFGAMVNLPKGMPMYTMDLKQLAVMLGDPQLPKQIEGVHDALADAQHNKTRWIQLQHHMARMGL